VTPQMPPGKCNQIQNCDELLKNRRGKFLSFSV
jgi:hypothetical protein